MKFTQKNIAQLVEHCINNNLTKKQAKFFLRKININPSDIEDSDDLKTYFINAIQYLLQRDELENWLKELDQRGMIFVNDYLKRISSKRQKTKPTTGKKTKNRNAAFFYIGCGVGNHITIIPLPNIVSAKYDFEMFMQLIDQSQLSELLSVKELRDISDKFSQPENQSQFRELILKYFSSIDKFSIELRNVSSSEEYRWFLLGRCILRIANITAASTFMHIPDKEKNLRDAVNELKVLMNTLNPIRNISKELNKLIQKAVHSQPSDVITETANEVAKTIGLLL